MRSTAKRNRSTIGERALNNLPRHLTSFIGRGTELSRLKSKLGRSRMVTLTGPGGAGKSRLAAELASACLDRWPHAVWWVELAGVGDPRQVAGAVVSALALPGLGPADEVAIAWLAGRQALLVLDNCEHLLVACAVFCQMALERCPRLTVIATSREPLGVPGEAQWPVSSLRASDAVRLFEARATLVRPDFKVAAKDADLVTEICERLDHLPLAIELAAARMGVMTEQEILSQLTNRFQLLTGGNRTAPERQRTMSATIDWSYRLLTDGEALLFDCLSVFRGGFDLDSVRAVCGEVTAQSAFDLLTGLVQKSMVVAERTVSSGMRYRLLESQLDYAGDRLREADDPEATRRRHYQYFLDCLIARTRNPTLTHPPPGLAEAQWIARESGNLWAAMRWAQNNASDLGLTFAAYLARATSLDVEQARRLLADVLDRSSEQGLPRVYALRSAANLAYWQGDKEAAILAAEGALVLARELGDIEALAYTLTVAAVAHEMLGEIDTAFDMYSEARSHLRGSGDRPLLTQIRTNLAWLSFLKGDQLSARDNLLECAAAARADGDLLLHASCLSSLAWVQLGLNDRQAAEAAFKESLAISHGFMDKQELISDLQGLLCVASVNENDHRALRLAAAAGRLSHEWSVRSEYWPEMQAEESLRQSTSRLRPSHRERAWNTGWEMTLDQVIEFAMSESETETSINAGPLSRREREVAKLVAAGMTNRQIGERLFVSSRTVDGHVERIRSKLGVRSRTEVATWAVERGLTTGRFEAPASAEGEGPTSGPPSRRRS